MSYDATIRRGDTLPGLSAILTNADGSAPDLTDTEVTLVLRGATVEAPETVLAATVTDPATAAVALEWTRANTPSAPGVYFARWALAYPTGQSESFPSEGNGFTLQVI